jgi:hypothetical protein
LTMFCNPLQVLSGERTLDTFRADLARFTAQQSDIVALPETRDVGILRVSSAQLKASLLPGPVQCLQKISSLLPQLAAQKYQEFIADVHDSTARLTTNPSTVEEFVEHVSFLQVRVFGFCIGLSYEFSFCAGTTYCHRSILWRRQIPEVRETFYEGFARCFSIHSTGIYFANQQQQLFIL